MSLAQLCILSMVTLNNQYITQYSSFVANGFQDGYTMEQAERREPMPEYPNPGTLHKVIMFYCNPITAMRCFKK